MTSCSQWLEIWPPYLHPSFFCLSCYFKNSLESLLEISGIAPIQNKSKQQQTTGLTLITVHAVVSVANHASWSRTYFLPKEDILVNKGRISTSALLMSCLMLYTYTVYLDIAYFWELSQYGFILVCILKFIVSLCAQSGLLFFWFYQ